MIPSSKNSAAAKPSETKNDFDDDRYYTLPNPSGVEVQNALPEGSVMWDGPPSSEGGARSAVPAHQGTKTSFSVEAVTNSPTAVREVNLGAASTSPDAQHKSVEITDAQQASSSIPSLCDAASANEMVFDTEEDSAVRQQRILAQIEATPARVRPLLKSLHTLIDGVKQKGDARSAVVMLSTRRPASLSTLQSMEELQELMAHGQKLLDQLHAQRVNRKDKPPSEKTIAAYLSDCEALDDLREHFIDESRWPWFEVLMQFVERKSTFYTYRAALSWRASKALQGLLKAHESSQVNLSDVAALELMPQIKTAVQELGVVA